MANTVKTIHDFSVYEIKRNIFMPYEFRWTKFYENNSDFLHSYPEFPVDKFLQDESIICSTVIDPDNYSILTTRRIITKNKGVENQGYMADAKTYHMPVNYKLEKFGCVFGTIKFKNETVFSYFLETGKASMVMIYGIKTLIWAQELTDLQMINLIRLWDKRSKH